jgi:glycosyltransferase involved in cell wall biosynthesis
MAPVRVAVTLEQCWHRVPGGVAAASIHASRALAARPDIEVVGVSARHRRPPPEPWVPPVPVRPLPLTRTALYESWHRARRPRVERATGPVDAIWVAGMAMPPPSAPLVVTVHDLAFLDERSAGSARGLRFFRRAVDLARRDATLVTCPSQATMADCEAHGFDPAKLRLVPWGIDVQPASPDEVEQVRAAYRLERPYVLSVGTVEPRKNLPALLDAFSRLDRRGLELVLVGPKGWNEDLSAHLGKVEGRVRTLGFVPERDKHALLAGAALFCYPSRREGFGLPVLEAMAQGAPVITSAGTATAEVGGDAAVLVDPLDVDALTAAMAEVLDTPELEDRRRAASRRRAGEWPWSRTAELLDAVLREAAGSGAGA